MRDFDFVDFSFVLIDKPKDIKSREISKKIANLLGKKAAHLGTLDPDATGVLPILLGRSTILTHFIMAQDKEYYAKAQFENEIDKEKLKEVVNSFVGKVWQIPPKISAVAKRKRMREIYEIKILKMKEKEFEFKVSCQAGTYIRTLIEDIGKKMNNNARMADLRRTKVGKFTIDETIKFDDFLKIFEDKDKEKIKENLRKILRPIEEIVYFKRVWINDGAVEPITLGVSLKIPGIIKFEKFKKGDYVAILNKEGKLIAIGKAVIDSDEILRMEKGEAVKIDRVIRKIEHLNI